MALDGWQATDGADRWRSIAADLAEYLNGAQASMARDEFGADLRETYVEDHENLARRIADGLAKAFPADTVVNRYWLPTIRAVLEIDRRNPAKAIGLLAISLPYELGNPLPQVEIGAYLYPVYIRGQSYLLLKDGEKAAEEFNKFLSHPGVTINCPLGVLARLQLGRAYRLMGDTAKTRNAYQGFLTRWKNADSDVPILKEAKAEYATQH